MPSNEQAKNSLKRHVILCLETVIKNLYVPKPHVHILINLPTYKLMKGQREHEESGMIGILGNVQTKHGISPNDEGFIFGVR